MLSTGPSLRCALLALLATLAVVPAAHATPGTGVNVHGVPTPQNVSDVIASGSQYARFFVLWSDMEANRGSYDGLLLQTYQDQFRVLNSAGVKPVVVIFGAPSWANGSSDVLVPPARPAEFGSFAGWLAGKLRGQVAGYEIWNEPDAPQFWHPKPDAGAYVALLKASHAAIKAADPGAKVVAGPTTGNDYKWVDALYDNGAKGSFDAVGVHTDTACLDRGPDFFYREDGVLGQFTFLGYRSVHDVMASHGDGDKPIWMTELGWSSTNKTCERGAWAGQKPAGVGEANQAAYLQQAYHCLSMDPYVQVAMWFNLQDLSAADEELNRYGLLRADHSQKPSWNAFRGVAVNGDQLTGECGDFGGPQLTVLAPTAGAMYTDGLFIKASAVDGQGISRYTFLADGNKIRNFTDDPQSGGSVEMLWHGAGDLKLGAHTITVIAVDKNGNESRQDVQVKRVRPGELTSGLQPVRVKLKVRGKGLIRRVFGRVISSQPASGKVRVLFQVRRGGRWHTRHKMDKNASRPFRVTQRLAYPGRWRVKVKYPGSPPFKAKTARSRPFAAR